MTLLQDQRVPLALVLVDAPMAIRAVSLATRMAVAPVLSTRAEIERAIDTLMVGPRATS